MSMNARMTLIVAGILALSSSASADDSGKYVGKWLTDTTKSKIVGTGGQLAWCNGQLEGPLTYIVSAESVAVDGFNCRTNSKKADSFAITCPIGTRQTTYVAATIANG